MNKTNVAQRVEIRDIDNKKIKSVNRIITNVVQTGAISASGNVRFSHCDWPVKTDDMFSGEWFVSFS